MPPVSPALRSAAFLALCAEQDGVFGRDQLRALRVHRALVARRVAAGLWQAIGPHVVVLQPGPLTRSQQYWVGVLHGGPGAVLSGVTALEAAGLEGFDVPEVHVLAPHGHGRSSLVTDLVVVRVRETRLLDEHLPLLGRRPPRLPQVPAAVVAASCAPSARACRTVLAMVVQQRLAAPTALREHTERFPKLRRRALILETTHELEGGAQSLPELEYLAGLRRYGLPEPTRQRVVRRPDGRYLLDAEFDAWLVTVEVNGVQHLSVRQKEWDDVRRTRLAIGGRLVVDLSSHTVRHDIALAVLLTADALFARGWRAPAAVRRRLLRAADRHPTFRWTSGVAA